MIRTRFTWLIVGGVIALLIAASVDAFRSSDTESTAAPTTAPTTAAETAANALPRCTRRQIAVSIEILASELGVDEPSVATIVLRHVGGSPCAQAFAGSQFMIRDRAGSRIGFWTLPLGGAFSTGTEQTFRLPGVRRCDRRGPFVAVAKVGPYTARRGKLSRSEITC